jgi:hypothetical protein
LFVDEDGEHADALGFATMPSVFAMMELAGQLTKCCSHHREYESRLADAVQQYFVVSNGFPGHWRVSSLLDHWSE